MNKETILLIDDDMRIRRMLRISLEGNGYGVVEAATAGEARVKIATRPPQVVILDLNLPDADGRDLLRDIREFSKVPILVLSVISGDEDKINLLDSGADDYLTKPFVMGELLARIRVTLRRASTEKQEAIVQLGHLTVDLGRRVVLVNNEEVHLTPMEYSILRLLVTHSGRVMTHQQIIREVWGASAGNESAALRVHVNQLRQKLEENPSHPTIILTEPGVGYRLKDRGGERQYETQT